MTICETSTAHSSYVYAECYPRYESVEAFRLQNPDYDYSETPTHVLRPPSHLTRTDPVSWPMTTRVRNESNEIETHLPSHRSASVEVGLGNSTSIGNLRVLAFHNTE